MWHVSSHNVYTSFTQCQQEGSITGEAVDLGNQDGCTMATALLKCELELWAVVDLAAFDLCVLANDVCLV